MKTCSIDECNKPSRIKTWCPMHYERWKSHGDTSVVTVEMHGLSNTPEYMAWASMKKRCYNQKDNAYIHYGGRGIEVCDEWKNSFLTFLQDMGLRPEGTSIDRINNDGNYEPSNCKWSTLSEQANNRRLFKTNKSGVMGISYKKRIKKWYVEIRKGERRVYIGVYNDLQDAILAQRKAL